MKEGNHPPEPFRIKSVEPIRLLNRPQREKALQKANYNLFKIDAEDCYLDFLTDSGTTAMSNTQWAALMMGDESYAGAKSFRRFEKTVQRIFGKKYVIPCHQGRVAENLLFSTILKKGQVVLNNTHFDTTRGNVLHKGGTPIDLPSQESQSDEALLFKGNMDVDALEQYLSEHPVDSIAMVMLTVTNNSAGGQAVSMQNIREVSEICKRFNLSFYLDCARFAENCYFIKRDESGYANKSIEEIAVEMFTYCDGVMMSAKKDGMANMGGFLALNDETLYRKITELMILIEGFPTYGGLTGRDMEVLNVGLQEVMDFNYLDYRVEQIAYLGKKLQEAGMPIVRPTGGHAVFVDAGRMLTHLKPEHFPAQGLSIEFYLEGGIRTVEIGSLMFGYTEKQSGKFVAAPKELVRIALPRRVYTKAHLDFVAEIAKKIVNKKNDIPAYKIEKESEFLRHFTCDLSPMMVETEIIEAWQN